MKWTLDEPKFGDIIRIKLGSIYHLGIYVSDDEVIQFGLPPTTLDRDLKTVFVCATDINVFLCGKFLEVGVPDKQEKKKMRSPEEIVKIARSRIGEGGYNILYNNCEHFVNQCAFGTSACEQIESIRKMWHNFNLIDVYVKKFPFAVKDNKIYPKERKKEIDNCSNQDVKNEKFYAWKLLEYALRESIGKDLKKLNIYKEKSKWLCDDCEFSISHCDNLVAIVISKKPVGIDIEKIDKRFDDIKPSKILCEDETLENEVSGQYLNKVWTIKEAVFKKHAGENFNPAKISLTNEKYATKIIKDGEVQYYLTLASDDCVFAKYHIDESLKIENIK